jgi:hypothetical protein
MQQEGFPRTKPDTTGGPERREEVMKGIAKVFFVAVLALLFAGTVPADTLELKDGRVLHGRYLGGTQAQLRFEVHGRVETFSVTQIVALTFTSSYGGSAVPEVAPVPAPAPEPAPAPAPEPASSEGIVNVPAGTPLLVRMIDGVDSSKNYVGDIFHASLETDLVVNDVTVARRGTDVYGRLGEAKQAGHYSGSSELQLELTRMVIDGRDYPVVSSNYDLKGKGRGEDTAKKVGGGAVVGAIIGAIAGGGKGAAIGAGAGSVAGGGVQIFTRGQKVKIPSETLLEFRLQQPVSVQPTTAPAR